MATQKEIAQHLDMSERNCRDVLKTLGIDWNEATLDEIRVAYIRDLREKAAGRGGSQAELLAAARIEESTVKAANGRLAYHEKLGTLVPTADAAFALNDWASFANREYQAGVEKLTQEIETKLKVSIDRGMVDRIAGTTISRIGGYADKLGQRIAGGSQALQSAQAGTDS
ncbi:hypothetical protein SAMN05216578_102267 [Halopseudomonas formosensis]|jgi:hypothetical protein|uniref:Uncharacterized protein n=1 Tax=Halopseudomonas formosensis TaxID=1002526 RepID=A0A1I6ANT9_9GAMM|nr:hypothetical protein [Halopseudomonas formosensis]SFQ70282.1 hypothetical protein SAMN05216578_102267 [Halopseudomonas formosensis]